ncbi:MAG: histidine kinase [Sphingobacteriales bacterium]|nr:histidine kinase [Sphingobacteriales bacterium]
MTTQELIFSNNKVHRISRHIILWLVFCVHFIIQNLIVGSTNEALKTRTFAEAAFNLIHFLPVYIISVYVFILWIIPGFLYRSKLSVFMMLTASLLIIDFVLCYTAGLLYVHSQTGIPVQQITLSMNKYNAVVNSIFLPLTLLGITGGIKAMKTWYLKQRENEQLAAKKIWAELQLLKIQINPRFLFHALATIKANIREGSVNSPLLILKISDMLSYVLYESEKERVLLSKETDIIKDYLALEEKSTAQRVKSNLITDNSLADVHIPPLIFLSLCEVVIEYLLATNDYKLYADILFKRKTDHQLLFQLTIMPEENNFTVSHLPNEILAATRMQLQNHYAGTHNIEIFTHPDKVTITINLFLADLPAKNVNTNSISLKIYEAV